MNNLYDYLSESDRNMFLLESILDNKIKHMNSDFDKLMLEHQYNLSSIETKVLLENGTYDDLSALYLYEQEEVKEKGQGFLSKIFSAIINFFRNIKNAIFGKKDQLDPNKFPDQLEVPADFNKIKSDTDQLMGGINSFLSGNKGKLTSLLALGVGFTAYKLNKNNIENLYKDIEQYTNDVENKLTEYQKQIENNKDLSPEDQNIIKNAINRVKTYGAKALDVGKAITKAGDADFQEIHTDNKEKRKNDKEEKKINDAKNKQQTNSQRIAELTNKIQQIDPLISQLEKEKTRLSNSNANGNGIMSKFKSRADERKMRALEKKGKNRSPQEDLDYNNLKSKYRDHGNNKNARIQDIDNTIKNLRDAGKKMNNEISNLKNTNNQISQNLSKKNKSNNDDIISHANDLLKKESVLEFVDASDIETLIDIL